MPEGSIPILLLKGVENPRGPECQAMTAHGFAGREPAVMKGIGKWLLSGRPPPVID